MTIDSFEALPLAAPLQRALHENNYTTPSPIQAQAIPPVLEGRDLLGAAQTGTGKTAAFSLPILHQFATNPKRMKRGQMRALVLTPTRELAIQVSDSFSKYGKHVRFFQSIVYGGVGQHPQVKSLARGSDVLVATPGRLLDLFEQGYVDFSAVEFFVLDEADRMLDMGFIHDMRRIIREIPNIRQTLFFSATMAPAVRQLAESILHNPVGVSITPEATTAEKVEQRLCLVDGKDKLPLLADLIRDELVRNRDNLTLVFSRTKHGANKLATQLSKFGIRADAIHGNKSQTARQRALEGFRNGNIQVLVATDVAARGIDVKNISLVINYDLPEEAEAYVHRIGRTARAGESGLAISFVSDDEFGLLNAIERKIRQAIPVMSEQAFHAVGLEAAHDRRRQAPAYVRPNPRGRSGPPRGRSGPPRSRGSSYPKSGRTMGRRQATATVSAKPAKRNRGSLRRSA